MNRITHVVVILLIVFKGLITVAAESYSFSESIDVLKRHNAELKAAEANLDTARANLNSSYSSFLPQVSANISYSRDQNDGIDGEGYSAGISASENLFNGFADVARMDSAKAAVTEAEANLKNVKAKLSSDLKVAFAGYAYADDSVRLADSIFQRRTENLNIVELRFQTGRENKGSVLLSKAYLKQAKLDVLKAKNALEIAKNNLVRVLGLPPLTAVTIKDRVPESSLPAQEPDFLSIAQSVPDRVISQSKIKSAEANLQSTRSSFYPKLNVDGSVGSSGQNYFPDDNERWSVGVSLSWSLFNGGGDYFRTKASLAQKLVAENNLMNMDLSLGASLRQIYFSYIEAAEEFDLNQAFAEAAGVRAEIGRSKYNNGLSTFDDWDVIENDLISRQKELTAKRRDKVNTEAAWEKAQGIGVVP